MRLMELTARAGRPSASGQTQLGQDIPGVLEVGRAGAFGKSRQAVIKHASTPDAIVAATENAREARRHPQLEHARRLLTS